MRDRESNSIAIIEKWMAPLWMLYIMTMTYIFTVINFEMWIWKTVRSSEKCPSMTFRGWYLPSNGTIVNVLLRNLNHNFQDQTFQVAILKSKAWENVNITIAIGQVVRYLPSNGTTANVVHHDLDLHFQGREFWNVNILKAVRASKKC